MRKLIIKRNRSFIGYLAVIQIICDGKIVGSLRPGATAEIEIDDNKHTVYAVHNAGIGNGIYGMASDVINIPGGASDIMMKLSFGFSIKLTVI